MKFLNKDFNYKDLQNILPEDLPELAGEVRQEIIKVVTQNGGHLGSSLGAVDLIIAMLKCFDPVKDRIIFDVGHQSYAYKILTDRFNKFNSLRLKDGIAGFPRVNESPCDHFNTGHSSTSISAALGYAKARDLLGEKREVIAFIGDAALINGLALEALNYVRETKTKLIIVLNDNKHSISNRVGGFSTMLARLSANKNYNKLKAAIKEYTSESVQKKLEAVRDQIKNLVKPENMFDDLDINYWGPFDGHDINSCATIFELAKNYDRPVLLHFMTQKGKGLKEAEQDPTKYHQVAPASFNKVNKAVTKSWSEAASSIVEDLAANNSKIVCFTAAMSTGVKLENFRKIFPERFFDVGIAESHMLTMAAGMAAGGLKPWVFIYSTFLQRAMDQLMHDIALQNLPVVLMIDRAGLVGSDGDTHQGLLDVSWGRAVPNLKIYSPCDYNSLNAVINHVAKCTSPIMIRYPRGNLPERAVYKDPDFNFNAVNNIAEGFEWALLGHGVTTHLLLEVRDEAAKLNLPVPAVYDLLRLKPLDDDALNNIFNKFKLVVTAEENYLKGGIGEAIAAKAAGLDVNVKLKLKSFGVPDVCVAHALPEEQRETFGLTVNNIINTCRKFL